MSLLTDIFGKPVGGHGSSSPRVSGISDDALTPVPESVAGPVFAYRGTEQHGVPVHAGTSGPEDAHGHYVDAVIVEEEREPHPIAVRVVKEDGDEHIDWRVITSLVDGTPRMIVNRMRERLACKVTCFNAGTIFIGTSHTVSPLNGQPIGGWSFIDLKTTEAIWAVSQDGSPMEVRILVEFAKGH